MRPTQLSNLPKRHEREITLILPQPEEEAMVIQSTLVEKEQAEVPIVVFPEIDQDQVKV